MIAFRGLWPAIAAAWALVVPAVGSAQLARLDEQELARLRAQEQARAERALQELRRERAALGLGPADDVRPLSVHTDAFGQTHVHVEQRHAGVPVWGGMAILHVGPDGLVLPPTAEGIVPHVAVELDPVFDAGAATELAILAFEAKSLAGLSSRAREVIYPVMRRVSRYPDRPLGALNAIDLERRVEDFRHAFHVHLELDNPIDGIVHRDFLVDARTGAILRSWDSLQTAAAVGTGFSLHAGTVQLDTWQRPEDNLFELRDVTRATGDGNVTVDAQHADPDTGLFDPWSLYVDADNQWGDGMHFTGASTVDANGQTAAVDAHWGLQVTWDYLDRIHGRWGIDGLGTPTMNRVHVGNAYQNAFWSDDCFCMSFGDGAWPSGMKSMAALDVAAHELGHGLTSQTARLIYDGESGGLNEATSDILGAMVEFWQGSGQGPTIGDAGGDWFVGEDLFDGGALRAMFKPSLDGASADAWFPGIDQIDVHYSSGPMNRAFYFLAEGADPLAAGTDRTSTYLPAGMTGIGKNAAIAIWYRALTVYLYASADYVSARTASLRAAADLHGRGSIEFQAVQDAFAAINVGYTAATFDDVDPPVVSLALDGAGPVVELAGTATDNVGVDRVEFRVGDTLVATRTFPPWSVPFDVRDAPPGAQEATLVAWDRAGNRAESAPVALPVAAGSGQLFVDRGFEQGGEAWTQQPPGIVRFPAPGAAAGEGYARLGGTGVASNAFLVQQVHIPASATRATLEFCFAVTTSETSASMEDYLVVAVFLPSGVLDVPVGVLPSHGLHDTWQQASFDLSAWIGQTVLVGVVAVEDDGDPTAFLVDEFALRVSSGPDTTPPSIVPGVAFDRDEVVFNAAIFDESRVTDAEFLVDGISLGSTAPAFGMRAPLASFSTGAHELRVRATDAAGNLGESAPVTFHVDNGRTQLLQNPGFEQLDAAGLAHWPVTPAGAANVFFFPDPSYAHGGTGSLLFMNNQPAPATVHQEVALPADTEWAVLRYWMRSQVDSPAAANEVRVEVQDAAGTTQQVLATFGGADDPEWKLFEHDVSAFAGQTIRVAVVGDFAVGGTDWFFLFDDFGLEASSTPDPTAPRVRATVVQEAGGFRFTAEAGDDVLVTELRFLLDGALIHSVPTPRGGQELFLDATTLAPGIHEMHVVALDPAGNQGVAVLSFGIQPAPPTDIQPPAIALVATGVPGERAVEAIASDDTGVALVEFFLDGALVASDSSAPWRLEVADLGLHDLHLVRAVAWDGYGNMAEATLPLDARPMSISPEVAVLPVGTSLAFSASAADPAAVVEWAVVEGPTCGSIDGVGLYQAPDVPGLCHVVAQASVSSAAATVRVFTADANGDGIVDGTDMGILAAAWGSAEGGFEYASAVDFDADGTVGDIDVNLFLDQFGRQP